MLSWPCVILAGLFNRLSSLLNHASRRLLVIARRAKQRGW